MLRADLTTFRRTSEPDLRVALGRHDPLALAEACSRTLPVAYAVGRRYLPSVDLDALLHAVYEQLWADGPGDVPLERWVRARCSDIALAELRARGAAPAMPSVRALAPDLPVPSLPYLDTTERTLGDLDDEARLALLRAHDRGVPSGEQGGLETAQALVRALRTLADPDGGDDAPDDVDTDGRLADRVLGLLPAEEAAALDHEIAADPIGTARAQVLRRGRRRIEGLPPTPDLGPRLVAAVLSGAGAASAADAVHTGEEPASEELLDTGWQPTDTGVEEGPPFDETPPGGLPVAGSALDRGPAERDEGLRLSDLFDDEEDEDDADGTDPAGDEQWDVGDDDTADTADTGEVGEVGDVVGQEPAAGYDDEAAYHDEDTELVEQPSAARRLVRLLGLLLLLAAAVGVGLLIGQVGVDTLRG